MKFIIRHKIELLLFFGLLFVICAPYLFTQSFRLTTFNDTGQIGDTIGGITAPISSLIGSILVYFALKEQIVANRLVFAQFEYQKIYSYISEQISILRDDIDKITLTTKRTSIISGQSSIEKIPYIGTEAIENYFKIIDAFPISDCKRDSSVFHDELVKINIILSRFQYLIKKLDTSIISLEDKVYFIDTIMYTYESRIKHPLEEFEHLREKLADVCSQCGKKHKSIPENIYSKYDFINSKLVKSQID